MTKKNFANLSLMPELMILQKYRINHLLNFFKKCIYPVLFAYSSINAMNHSIQKYAHFYLELQKFLLPPFILTVILFLEFARIPYTFSNDVESASSGCSGRLLK